MAIAPTVGKKALVVNMFDGGTGTTVGLKIDVKRFNDACTYIDNAQQNIKNCRDSLGCISNAKPGLASLTEFKSLESIFNNSKLAKLATKIESIKGKIIQLDENFATEYMKLAAKKLQDATNTINSLSKKKFEEMTPGERKNYNAAVEKYNNAVKDYDETLLYMLEKYEEDGMLTPEMEIQLQCQRIVVQQHEIEAKLSSIKDQLSDEYRKLYEEYSNNQRKLIQLNPNLTEEERNTKLAEFEATYNDYLKSSTEAKANRQQEEKLIKELEELYNQGASKATIISKKQEIADVNSESPYAPTADELEYMDMNGFEKVMVNTGTFIASTFTGVLSVAEGVVDGSVMLISGAGAVFGADTKWAESYIKTDIAGSLYDDIVSGDLASAFVFGATSVAETIIDSTLNVIDDVGSRCGADTKWAEDFASIDISGTVYEETKDLLSMNEVIAYGDAHTAGNFFGETGTHLALTFLAPWATATVNGLEGMGSKAEQVLLEDGSYQEAFGRGFLSGVGSAFSGYAMSSFNSRFISSGAFKTIGQTIFNTAKTEGFKGLVQGLGKVGGKQLVNIALNSLRDVDSWVETGCVLGDNILSGIADEEIDWGKTFTQTAMVFLAEFAANFLMGTASDIAAPKLTHMLKQAELESAFNGPEADAYFHNMKQNELDSAFNGPEADAYFDFIDIVDPTNKTSGERLPNWSNASQIERAKQTLFAFEDITGQKTSQEFRELFSDALEKDYKYNLQSAEGATVIHNIQKYYDNRVCQQIDNNIYDTIKKSLPEEAKFKIESYSINADGALEIKYSYDGEISAKTLSKFESSQIFDAAYETAGWDTIEIITHYEEDIPNIGKNRTYKYEALNNYSSIDDVINNMTDADISEYEATWKNNFEIDNSGEKYNFGFFTTEENIAKYAKNDVIGYDNANGTKTQWAFSMESLKSKLNGMTVNGQKLTSEMIKTMPDAEIINLVEDAIAVPRGSYSGKKLTFIAGNRNINISNITANTLAGANDLYVAYGRTAGNMFEADVGAVDLNDSNITKKSIEEIREMFLKLLS